ncbi:acyl-CoA thioesterase [Bacillus lacus]|uniref:Acyl-CoA thioesterase n=1 Tax=Metabacillus lacus TaxID=1983721 RepID=A0A7X2LZ76_9BACI|nr:acyl-CoA thioesterase [Metabacillus lacus]MRX71647.1 acyl-CoA thioesterase [Metabacillus lacus]
MEEKFCRDSFTVKTSIVLPPDTNNYRTLFGGKLMAYIDDVAAIAATRHARSQVVTASTDSVDFLHPIYEGNSVCLEAFVTYTGRTSMEVFVKVIAEDMLSGNRSVCAISFLTMVAVDKNMKTVGVPRVIPQSSMEKSLNETGKDRAAARKRRKQEFAQMAELYGTAFPWS